MHVSGGGGGGRGGCIPVIPVARREMSRKVHAPDALAAARSELSARTTRAAPRPRRAGSGSRVGAPRRRQPRRCLALSPAPV